MLLAAACLEKADASPADDWCQILLCSAMMVMKDLAAIVSGSLFLYALRVPDRYCIVPKASLFPWLPLTEFMWASS